MAKSRISETVSEIRPKPKGGRPSDHDPDLWRFMESNFPEVRSRRGRLNLMYQTRAVRLLNDDPAFAWVCDGKAMMENKPNAYRPT